MSRWHLFVGTLLVCILAVATMLLLRLEKYDTGPEMRLETPVVSTDEMLPDSYTCPKAGYSWPFTIEQGPEGVQSYALLLYQPNLLPRDPSYWMIYDIPVNTTSVPEGLTPGKIAPNRKAKQALMMPCVTAEGERTKFILTLYALDAVSGAMPIDMAYPNFISFVHNHTIAQSDVTFYVKNKPPVVKPATASAETSSSSAEGEEVVEE